MIPRSEILYKGQFTYEWLYKIMYMWLAENNYKDRQGTGDKIEDFYFENVRGNGAKEIWYWWRVQKQEDEMFRYQLNIDGHLLGLSKSERMVEGVKLKTNDTEVSLFFTAHLYYGEKKMNVKDYKLIAPFNNWLWRKANVKTLEAQKRKLYMEVHELLNIVKQHLGVYQHMQLTKPFHDPKGVPQLR